MNPSNIRPIRILISSLQYALLKAFIGNNEEVLSKINPPKGKENKMAQLEQILWRKMFAGCN